MKRYGFDASTDTRGGTSLFLRMVLSSLILALMIASFSGAGAFAAPGQKDRLAGGISGSQLRELGAAMR